MWLEELEEEFPDKGPKKKRGGHNKLPADEALRRSRERNRKRQAHYRAKHKDRLNERRRVIWAKNSEKINKRRRDVYNAAADASRASVAHDNDSGAARTARVGAD
jgi:hypothetical protein